MRPVSQSVSSATTSDPIIVSQYNQFQIGFGVALTAGASLTYKIQHTFDDLQNPLITPVWFDHAVVTGQTANKDGNYAFPIMALRLNVTAWTSGTAKLTALFASR